MNKPDGGKGSAPRQQRDDEAFSKNYDAIFGQQMIEDGRGNSWTKCSRNCWLEVVRPGEVQCNHPKCPK